MTTANDKDDGLGSQVKLQLGPVFRALEEMTEVDTIVKAEAVREALIEAIAEVARHRRQAVRSLRSEGWLLREIADACEMSHQRISQIETGYSRKRGE